MRVGNSYKLTVIYAVIVGFGQIFSTIVLVSKRSHNSGFFISIVFRPLSSDFMLSTFDL